MFRRESDPSAPFGELRREVDRLFDSFIGGVNRGLHFRGRFDPPANLYEDDECLCAELEVPGLTMNDLDVHIVGGELTVKGRYPQPRGENVTTIRQERATGEFSRHIPLDVDVDTDKVSAVLKDGVLTITLPKTEGVKPRKVPVRGE